MTKFPWAYAFQIIAFCIGWGMASESEHPLGAFVWNWALWAGIFWFVGYLINGGNRAGRSSGEGPGSGNSGSGGA